MADRLPQIGHVTVESGHRLLVTWAKAGGENQRTDLIDLGDWIASGSEIMAPLRDPDVFGQAKVGEHGASVTWDDDTGDLSIDAYHLELLRREQATHAAA